ncbi:MAG: hypothetical protein ACSHWU_10090 [Marinicella sp.]
MQQLVIKLSPQATAQYLKIAGDETSNEFKKDQTPSGIQLDINMALMAGLCFADIDVNGQSITSKSDDEDLELELVELG